jgi:ABC-type Zn uptake system ZnuABC Zn-binding protein ZnuA
MEIDLIYYIGMSMDEWMHDIFDHFPDNYI